MKTAIITGVTGQDGACLAELAKLRRVKYLGNMCLVLRESPAAA